MTFGEKLKKLRTERGLSQKTVADKTGVHANSYGQYERGIRKPDGDTVKKLARALDCDVEYLMDEKEAAGKTADEKPKGRKAGEKASGTVKHIFEVDGSQVVTDDVQERIYEDWKAEGHRVGNIKKLDIYYNFGERRAYYVINDKAEDRFVEF